MLRLHSLRSPRKPNSLAMCAFTPLGKFSFPTPAHWRVLAFAYATSESFVAFATPAVGSRALNQTLNDKEIDAPLHDGFALPSSHTTLAPLAASGSLLMATPFANEKALTENFFFSLRFSAFSKIRRKLRGRRTPSPLGGKVKMEWAYPLWRSNMYDWLKRLFCYLLSMIIGTLYFIVCWMKRIMST